MTALIPGTVVTVLVVSLCVELLLAPLPSPVRFVITGVLVSAVLAHLWRFRRRGEAGAP